MGKIIDGKSIANKIKDDIAKEIYNLGQRPNLAIILLGAREDSKLYVKLKQKQAKTVGIDTHFYHLEEDSTEEELIEVIEFLNKDPLIDGILVQLPLPKHIDADKVVNIIDPKKDVDGFNKKNLDNLDLNETMISPVFSSVLKIFEAINYKIENKKIALVYNSEIFGNNLLELLEKQKAELLMIQKKTIDKNIDKLKTADVIITVIGQPWWIKKTYIKKEAVIIDIGITKKEEKVYGDANHKYLLDKVNYITPVPGGIGPITIAMLFKNTLKAFKIKKENK
ncbi:bifunctional 5,10-methylenetetrahydrofolate dehydrogenase/5,10-methenyltetrahydrofolate cyclohydrolase [Patescibacteria group bacterium]|nr:bifunctional 5,10-methylenetetrahydrofolate dehydrogenase/5,10-methenyltetrahydrofolate cyclohydrolase [Patescibacteria group bacterium]